MASTKEIGKRLSQAVEDESAKADTETPDDAAKPSEPPETPETATPEPAPDAPEAKPTATPSPEQTQKAFDKAVTAFHAKLCAIFEVEELQTAETPGIIGFLLPGFAEKRPHSDFTRCSTCNGWGKVLTGSIKAGDDEHDCPDPRCKGRGYWQKAQTPAPVVPSTMLPVPAQPNGGGDEWDRPSWLGDPRLSSVAP